MEDVHVIQLDARPEVLLETCGSSIGDYGHPAAAAAGGRVAFFGIWDGHGGVESATFSSQHLHPNAVKAGILKLKASNCERVTVSKLL